MAIPAGFDNNIAWNIGHIIVAQQRLHYALSGNGMLIPDHYLPMYKPGSSPADWEQEPDIAELLGFLQELPERLKADYADGIFHNYQSYTTSTGISLNNIEAGIAFNNFHEGLHLGAILALRNFVILA